LVNGRIVHEERLLQRRLGRIRDVRVGPDGLVYLLTDERDGAIYRLAPIR
jgi:glucose/arabinose dehydrogenase